MQQLGKPIAVFYHLYPGVIILLGFLFAGPLAIQYGYPPQFGLLLCIIVIAVPLLIAHLKAAKKKEHTSSIYELNGYRQKMPTGKLVIYSLGLVIFAFLIWGATQSLNLLIAEKLSYLLPTWFTVQDFSGYEKSKIVVTLAVNLVFNGFLAPFVEELYFRGYLLPRMNSFGKWSFVMNAVLFSLYHFWQPYIYFTLLFSLLPMTYLVWRTKDLRLGILTHVLLNVIGALLSFGLLSK
jgi:membrane protease YdiL (CAAX protease family)